MIRSAILIVLAGFALTLFGARVAYPALNGYKTYSIRTPSMQPTIPPGAMVYVDPDAEYGVGSIVTYAFGSDYVTHRLDAEFTGDGETGPFRTKGDNNNAPDRDYVFKPNIVGPVVKYLPLLGWADTILRIPSVMILLMLVALTILIGPALWNPVPPKQDVTAHG